MADMGEATTRLLPLLVPLHATPGDQPSPLTPERMLTAWTWNWWVGIAAILLLGLYLWGVVRLHRRGDGWHLGRTVAWCVGGVGTLVVATMSALGTYDTVLFSVHMIQHMVLTMVTPVFLALGAPVTLILRNCGPKAHATVLAVLHSRIAKVLLWPPLPTGLMCAVPFALYLTGWYEFTLRNSLAHDLLHMFFLTMGCMFFWPLLGYDPMPNRLPYPVRMLLFLITMPFHSFLGTMIMGSPSLIAEDWYTSFLRAWPPSPQEDQYIAGAILWAAGDFIMIIVVTSLFVQWRAASEREARRVDRRLDRQENIQRRREEAAQYQAARAAAEADAGAGSTAGPQPAPNEYDAELTTPSIPTEPHDER